MAKRGSVAGKLKNMKGMWGKARDTTKGDGGGDFIPVEPGMYVMQIVGAEIGEYNKARKMWVKFAVVSDDENHGAICNDFMQIDTEEKLVWLQRFLVAMGVDLDEYEIEDENDLLDLVHELIDERRCARVQVTEKDGYTNMRVRKLVDADEDDLHDPKEALKGGSQGRGGDDDDEDEDGEEPEEGEDEEEPDEEDEGGEGKFEVGDAVTVEYDGVPWDGEVKAVMDETDELEVHFPEDGSTEVVAKELATKVEGDGEEAGEEEEEGGDEIEKGDRVIADVKGKKKSGVVQSVSKKNETCKVKLDKTGKVVTVDFEDVDFEVEE